MYTPEASGEDVQNILKSQEPELETQIKHSSGWMLTEDGENERPFLSVSLLSYL
jgi:hypothetical protein